MFPKTTNNGITMNKFLSMPIRRHMMILVVVMAMASIGIICFSAYHQYIHEKAEATEFVSNLASEVANDQDILLSGAQKLLKTLAYIPSVQQRDVNAVNTLLADIGRDNPQITNILMIDTSGQVWASTLPLKEKISAADRRFFKKAMATGSFSSGEFTIGRVLQKPAISFGYPVKDNSGKIRDIAAVAFTLTKYDKLLKMNNIPEHACLSLTDHKGTILFNSTASEYIGKQDREDLFKHISAAPDKGNLEAHGTDGVLRIFAYHKLRLTGEDTPYMYVRAGIPKEFVLAKVRKDILINTVFMFAFLLVASAFAVYISKRGVLDKVNALRDATRRVASGDYDVKVSDLVSGGEIGELGMSFDDMAQRLKQDITEQKEAEERLKQSEEKFYAAFRISPDAINISKIDDGKFITVNEAFTSLLGYSEEEVIGESSVSLGIWVNTEDRTKFAEQLKELGSVKNHEAKHRRKDGALLTVLLSSRVVEIDGEQCALTIIRDITEREIIREELIKMQKLESIGVLAGGIAHDFNNILTGIMGNISFAKMRIAESEEAYGLLTNAEKASQRAAVLAKQLLVFSKGGQPFKKPILLHKVLRETISLVLSGSNVKGRVDIPEPLHTVEADEGQLSQAFHNIIINALHSMPMGGRLIVSGENVTLTRDNMAGLPAGDYVKLSFMDEGCGIEEKDLKKIFDPYFTTKPGGSGLGLASAYAIVSKHGGQLSVNSVVGKGTTFTIHLPSLGMRGDIMDKKISTPAVNQRSGAILVMDDDEMVRDLAAITLERSGYQVKCCADGKEAISLYRGAKDTGTPFSAVIMDLTIPGGIGGVEVARRILEFDPAARLIVSSGYSDDPVMSNFKDYGFCAAMEKPFKANDITEILAGVSKGNG
jgi:PAS domain S-box-containing protein